MKILILFCLIIFIPENLGCYEQFVNGTSLTNARYGRKYIRNFIYNSTIICANIYSISEIYYKYYDHTYDQFLKVTESNITTLQPNDLFRFETIKILFLSKNHIQKIQPGAFNGLTKVKELYLDNNELSEITNGVFNSLHQLEILDLSRNKIYKMEESVLMGVASLEKLFLQNNNLTKIQDHTFDMLDHLTRLDLSQNPLEVLHLSNVSSLEYLIATDTNLSDFSGVSNVNFTMKFLNLSSSQLTSVDFGLFPKVKNLDLSRNKIVSIDKCQSLQSDGIYLQGNELKSINCQFYGLSYLVLSSNQLETVNIALFNNSKKLIGLDLSFNRISVIENNTFQDLASLNVMFLQNNNISRLEPNVFKDLTSLIFLNLSSNSIESFQYGTFNNLERLDTLDISNNKIKHLHPFLFYSVTKMRSLYFQNNQISSFDVQNLTDHLPSISTITLHGNPWNCEQLIKMHTLLKVQKIVEILEGDDFNEENFRGIACQNKQSDVALDAYNLTNILEKVINESVRNSELVRFLNEGFLNTTFVEFFEKKFNDNKTVVDLSEETKNMPRPAAAELKSDDSDDRGNGLIVLSIFLQIVMCCLLVAVLYFMYAFLKKMQPGGRASLSQVELCDDL